MLLRWGIRLRVRARSLRRRNQRRRIKSSCRSEMMRDLFNSFRLLRLHRILPVACPFLSYAVLILLVWWAGPFGNPPFMGGTRFVPPRQIVWRFTLPLVISHMIVSQRPKSVVYKNLNPVEYSIMHDL